MAWGLEKTQLILHLYRFFFLATVLLGTFTEEKYFCVWLRYEYYATTLKIAIGNLANFFQYFLVHHCTMIRENTKSS